MKKRMLYSILTLGVISAIAVGYVLVKTSYNGNNKIVFINSDSSYTSFQNLIHRPEFKNKIVYVDVWGTTCIPCFEELKNYTPRLTQHYQNKSDIAFLYICIDRHPFPEVRWKDKVEKLQPSGYHVLITDKEEPKSAQDIVGEAKEGQYFPYSPFYFIVNKEGQIIDDPNSNPEKGELRPSDTTLLYNKLDSLRRI